MVLRTVLFVHGVIALGLPFGSASPQDWLSALSLAVVGALPATLLWLLAACASRRLPLSARSLGALQTGLGAVAGLLAWGLLRGADAVPAGLAGALGSGGTGGAMAAAVIHWLRQRDRQRLPAGTQARLTELQSRIRPHFLFNALNSAIALVRVDPNRAEAVLEDLSELFRAALGSSGDAVTLAEEVELAQRYLAIEQVRFGARLKVSWVVDPAAARARVPALMLQPLVENAVRHGVEPAPDGGEIRIRAAVRQGQALLTITNTVPEGRPRRGHGIALRNVRDRLHLLHDLACRFEAGPIEGGRFRVRVALPLPPG